jgi:two-component system nitrate/nitrite response regulator NarL
LTSSPHERLGARASDQRQTEALPSNRNKHAELAPTPMRVLIVDDHAAFRIRARLLLEAAGYEVVGEAADAAGAIAETHRLNPDVLLLDVQLPDRDGFAVAAELAEGSSSPQIVLISTREAADYGSQLAQARARGFIHKLELSRSRLEQLVGTSR